MNLTDKFPGPWEVRKLLDGYKVVAADGRCLAMISAQGNSATMPSDDDAHALATAFAQLGAIQPQKMGRCSPKRSAT